MFPSKSVGNFLLRNSPSTTQTAKVKSALTLTGLIDEPLIKVRTNKERFIGVKVPGK